MDYSFFFFLLFFFDQQTLSFFYFLQNTVHSKKVPLRGLIQDGFVDDIIKLERIMRAIQEEGLVTKDVVDGALLGRTALPRSITHPLGGKRGGGGGGGGGTGGAGGGGAGGGGGEGSSINSADALIEHWTKSNAPIVVFGKTWCVHCRRVLETLKQNNIFPFVIWMDQREDESEIQISLSQRLRLLLLEKEKEEKKNEKKKEKNEEKEKEEKEEEESVHDGATTNSVRAKTAERGANTKGEGEGGAKMKGGGGVDQFQDVTTATKVLTVPQVFCSGHSLGGADDVERLCNSGGGVLLNVTNNKEWFDRWCERNGVDTCWEWVEAMHVNQELMIGVEYYKFMGEMEGGMKIFRPPKKNDVNCKKRPPF